MNCFVRYRESSLCPVSMVHVQQKGFLEQIISQADYEFLKQRLWEDGEYNYYFLIRLMTATGVRISELVLFDVEDVKKGYRDIYSKGNKLRRVYIPAVLRTAFKEWPGWDLIFKPVWSSLICFRDPFPVKGFCSKIRH